VRCDAIGAVEIVTESFLQLVLQVLAISAGDLRGEFLHCTGNFDLNTDLTLPYLIIAIQDFYIKKTLGPT
jgi:hypothetical protein